MALISGAIIAHSSITKVSITSFLFQTKTRIKLSTVNAQSRTEIEFRIENRKKKNRKKMIEKENLIIK